MQICSTKVETLIPTKPQDLSVPFTVDTFDLYIHIQSDTKKWELLKNPTKIEEIQEKKIIDRNRNITTCLSRDSNPDYQCLKITSCRWPPPPRMHSFTATTHFKSSRSFVSPSVCCRLCRMRLRNFQTLIIWITVS